GVLANDSDSDADPLTAVLVAAPAHGQLTFFANGSFLYQPAAGYAGPDAFAYQAWDGAQLSAVAVVSLTVADSAPAAQNDSYTVPQGVALYVSGDGVITGGPWGADAVPSGGFSGDVDATPGSMSGPLFKMSPPKTGLLANDSDADGDRLSVSAFTLPGHG